MEDTLRVKIYNLLEEPEVLILVLMEDTLRVNGSTCRKSYYLS